MKRLLALLIGLLLIAVGIQQVIADGSCTDCNWAPSSWTSVSVIIYPDSPNYAETQQSFVWYYENLEAFLALDAYYQYEIRRDRDVWDYMIQEETGQIVVIGSYWTTLPNPTDTWTEEADSGGDEEFELKILSPEDLSPDTWYVVYVEFWRDPEDRGTTFTLWSESEYCGRGWPFCDFGRLDWCVMTEQTEGA